MKNRKGQQTQFAELDGYAPAVGDRFWTPAGTASQVMSVSSGRVVCMIERKEYIFGLEEFIQNANNSLASGSTLSREHNRLRR